MPEQVPAIKRKRSVDNECEVIATLQDSVSFTRGFGDHGKRYEVVEHDCPACSMDRMLRRTDVMAEYADTVEYYCLSPVCPHYHNGQYDFTGMGTPSARKPRVTE